MNRGVFSKNSGKTSGKDLTFLPGISIIIRAVRGRGGIGRRVRLRGVWETVWVQVPSTAPEIVKSEHAAVYLL